MRNPNHLYQIQQQLPDNHLTRPGEWVGEPDTVIGLVTDNVELAITRIERLWGYYPETPRRLVSIHKETRATECIYSGRFDG